MSPELIRAGCIYLTFSGDEELPYMFFKVVKRIGDELFVKGFLEKYRQKPHVFDGSNTKPPKYIVIPVDMFLAWGPPTFPIEFMDEAVTEEELSQEYL